METIVVSGCSFTDKNFKSDIHSDLDTSYIKWPELIKFKGNIINVAQTGADNVTLINNVFDEMHNNLHIDRVIVALSSWLRFSTPDAFFHPATYKWYATYSEVREQQKSLSKIIKFMDHHKKYYDIYGGIHNNIMNRSIEKLIDSTLRHIWLLYNICKMKNIKLHIFQMLSPSQLNGKGKSFILLYEKFCHYLINHSLFSKIDKLKDVDLIGWPFEHDIGGNVCDYFLDKQCRISDLDGHPNEKGHRIIAHWFDINAKDT